MIIHDVVQNTLDWDIIRAGKPTTSCFGKIITPKTLKPAKTDYHLELAAEILAGHNPDPWLPDFGNIHTDHGLESEHEATQAYEDETGKKTESVGFITNDEITIGCSPDRLAGEYGLVEFKSLQAKNMIKAFVECQETGECPTDYKMQIQGQLMITGREWCDLCLFHPAIGVKIFRVFPNIEIHEKLTAQLKVIITERDKAVLAMVDF